MKHSDGIVWQIHHPPYTLGSELMVWVGSQSLWEPGEKMRIFLDTRKLLNTWTHGRGDWSWQAQEQVMWNLLWTMEGLTNSHPYMEKLLTTDG